MFFDKPFKSPFTMKLVSPFEPSEGGLVLSGTATFIGAGEAHAAGAFVGAPYSDNTIIALYNGDGPHPEVPDPGSLYFLRYNADTQEYDMAFDAGSIITSQYFAMGLSADGNYAAIASNGLFCVINVAQQTIHDFTAELPNDALNFPVFSPDNSTIVMSSYKDSDGVATGNYLFAFSRVNGSLLQEEIGGLPGSSPGPVTYSPDGSTIAWHYSNPDGRSLVAIVNADDWTVIEEDILSVVGEESSSALSTPNAISRDGTKIVIPCIVDRLAEPVTYTVAVFSTSDLSRYDITGSDLADLSDLVHPDYGLMDLVALPGGKYAFSYIDASDETGRIGIYNLSDFSLVHTVTCPEGVIPNGIAADIAGKRIFFVDANGTADPGYYGIDLMAEDAPLVFNISLDDSYYYGFRASSVVDTYVTLEGTAAFAGAGVAEAAGSFAPAGGGGGGSFALFGVGTGQTGNLLQYKPMQFSPVVMDSHTSFTSLSVYSGTVAAAGIKADGTIWAQGLGYSALVNVTAASSPAQIGSATNWTQVSVGSSSQMLALNSSGELFYLGVANGSAVVASNLTQIGTDSWTQVAAMLGGGHAIRDGKLYGWAASNANGQIGDNTAIAKSSPVQVGVATDWTYVSRANNGHCAGIHGGGLYCWGLGTTGQLGNGGALTKSSPVQVGTLTNWSKVGCGASFTVAMKTDGTLWSFGLGTSGQLGDGTAVTKSSPVQVGTETDWADFAVGPNATCVIAKKSNGTVYTWGANTGGQLGLGDITNRSAPTLLTVASGATLVETDTAAHYLLSSVWMGMGTLFPSHDFDHRRAPFDMSPGYESWQFVDTGGNSALNRVNMIAIKGDGTLWGCGDSTSFQLQNQTYVSNQVTDIVQIGSDTDWSHVASGDRGAMGIKTNGTLWGWGAGTGGQLGNGAVTVVSSPTQVGTLTNWAKVYMADEMNLTYAIKIDGSLWAWGNATNGQLGDGTAVAKSSPVQILTGVSVAMAALGNTNAYNNGACVTTDGKLYTWGSAASGALGNGTTTPNVSVPTQVGTLTDWAHVAIGSLTMMAVKTDGTLWGWGSNSLKDFGNGNSTPTSSPIQVGTETNWVAVFHGPGQGSNGTPAFCGLKEDGTLWAWGNNTTGFDPSGFNRDPSSPVIIPGISGATQIAVNRVNAYAIQPPT